MKLEYSILEHLSNNDNGKFIDVTFIQDDYDSLTRTLDELKGRNMILLEDTGRDFEAFGIGNDRKKSVKAKIKMNGRIYFHSMKIKNGQGSDLGSKKSRWSLSYFF